MFGCGSLKEQKTDAGEEETLMKSKTEEESYISKEDEKVNKQKEKNELIEK